MKSEEITFKRLNILGFMVIFMQFTLICICRGLFTIEEEKGDPRWHSRSGASSLVLRKT